MSFTGDGSDHTAHQIRVTDWTNGVISFVDSTNEVVYNRTSVYGLAPWQVRHSGHEVRIEQCR